MLRKGAIVVLILVSVAGCRREDKMDICMKGQLGSAKAIAACTDLIDQNRGSFSARSRLYMQRALHRREAGQGNAALTDIEVAVKMTPRDPNVYMMRGVTNGMAGRLPMALRDFDNALLINPNLTSAHVNRAKVLTDTGKFPEALSALDRAIELSKDNWIAYDGRCWTRAVIGEDLEGGLADCKRALELNPKAANPLNNRGLIHYKMKRYAESVADYTSAIAADPNMASSYYVRGLAYRALGEPGTAAADIAKAKQMEPRIADRFASYGIGATAP